jgi:sec-independent protein translocase protein TatC
MANDKQMTVIEHLEEMRRRIIISVVAILVTTGVAFFFSDAILKFLLLPSGGLQLRAFGLMDGFLIKWHIALYAGVVVAFPVWAYQIFRFIYPGLLDQERRAIFPMLVGALVLFVIGAIFGYYLLRGMIHVLVELYPLEVQFLPAADDYISFVLFFMVSSGLAFQLPIVLLLLIEFHIISTDLLRKQRRIAYFVLFMFAEIITPVTDPIIAPLTVMIPLSVLYELSIWLGRGVERRRKAAEAEPEAKQLTAT